MLHLVLQLCVGLIKRCCVQFCKYYSCTLNIYICLTPPCILKPKHLSKPLDVNAQMQLEEQTNNSKSQALIEAAQRGDLETITSLLSEHGISLSVNARDSHGRTALHYAAMEGNTDIINVLMRHDAIINLVDNDGKNPISVAKYLADFHHHTNID